MALTRIIGGWRLAWWGLAILLAAVYLASSFPRDRRLGDFDLFNYYIPQAEQIGRGLARGDVEWWNPEVGCGLEQVATLQSEIYYPFTLLHAVLPIPAAFGIAFGVHLAIAAFGVFAWVRALRLDAGPAVLASLAYLWGMIGEAGWPPMIYALAWLPWLLYFVDADELPGLRRWLGAVVALTAELLTGYPQFTVYGLLFIGAYFLLKSLAAHSVRPIAWSATVPIVAVLVAAVQLLPSFLYVGQTWRGKRLPPSEVHYLEDAPPLENSAVVRDAREVTLQLTHYCAYWGKGSMSATSERQSWGYLGVIAPLAVAIAWRRWRQSAHLVLRRGGPGGRLSLARLHRGPADLRRPGRRRATLRLLPRPRPAPPLDAHGLDRPRGLRGAELWPRDGLTSVPRLPLVLIAAASLAVAAFFFLRWGQPLHFAAWVACMALAVVPLLLPRARLARWPALPFALAYAAALVDVAVASGYVFRFFEHPAPFFHTIHTEQGDLLAPADLASLAARVEHDRLYIAEPALPVLRAGPLPAHRGMAAYEPLTPRRHFLLDDAMRSPIEGMWWPKFQFWGIRAVPHLRWFDWSSARLVVTAAPLPDAAAHGWREVASPTPRVHVYENQCLVPRASLWTDYSLTTDQAALAWLTAPSTGLPEPPQLEGEPPPAWQESRAAAVNTSTALRADGRITWLTDSAERIELDVACTEPAILVLADSYFPGWRCQIDDQPAPILRATISTAPSPSRRASTASSSATAPPAPMPASLSPPSRSPPLSPASSSSNAAVAREVSCSPSPFPSNSRTGAKAPCHACPSC